jgi:predicted phage tail protein
VGVLSYTPDSDLAEGKHYWRVRAVNSMQVSGPWSAASNITVDTNPPAAPILKQPFDNSVLTSVPTYSWVASIGANRYVMGYDTHSDCASPDYTSVELSLNNHKPVSQPYGTFYWCVRAKDAAGNWSAWSVPNKLIITPF